MKALALKRRELNLASEVFFHLRFELTRLSFRPSCLTHFTDSLFLGKLHFRVLWSKDVSVQYFQRNLKGIASPLKVSLPWGDSLRKWRKLDTFEDGFRAVSIFHCRLLCSSVPKYSHSTTKGKKPSGWVNNKKIFRLFKLWMLSLR